MLPGHGGHGSGSAVQHQGLESPPSQPGCCVDRWSDQRPAGPVGGAQNALWVAG